MENGAHADESSLNIQNEYFNNARKNRTRITVFLTNGQRITGLIRSFDKFTIILETRNGDQMVFKHAVTSVAAALPNQQDSRGPRPPYRPDQRPQGGGRPPQPPPHGGPPHPAGPGHPHAQGEGPRGGLDSRPRGSSAPQGRSFGNYMDLSAVKIGGAPDAGETPPPPSGHAPAEPPAPPGPADPEPSGPAAAPEASTPPAEPETPSGTTSS